MATYHELPKLRTLSPPSDEEEHERYEPKGKSKIRRCWDGFRASIGNILTLLLITLLFLNLHTSAQAGGIAWPWSGAWSVTHSYGKDERFMSLDHKYDPVWDDFKDANTAIIHIDDGSGRGYNGSIGMFHAMHCIWAMRHAMQRARAGEDIGVDHNDDLHWPHCFDYLRQAILCSADDTIERAHWTNKTVAPDSYNGAFIEGQLDGRKCRDSAKLYELRKLHAVHPPYQT